MAFIWQVNYYESPVGSKPVEEFINTLEEKTQNKIIRTLELLEEFGVNLGPPHTKKLTGTPLWELRIIGADNIRIFYVAKQRQSFLLLHGFKKKTQKTEKKEIKIALKRLSAYESN